VLQLELVTPAPAGSGSFRLLENSVTVGLRRKGTAISTNVVLPVANSDIGGTRSDADGVLSRLPFTVPFDGFWFNRGDLYRTLFTLPAATLDVDLVTINMNLSNNILANPQTLALSINGLKVGEITINPGDVVKNLSFPIHFVNPVTTARDTASNLYNDSKH
jgi:hypothetical protein